MRGGDACVGDTRRPHTLPVDRIRRRPLAPARHGRPCLRRGRASASRALFPRWVRAGPSPEGARAASAWGSRAVHRGLAPPSGGTSPSRGWVRAPQWMGQTLLRMGSPLRLHGGPSGCDSDREIKGWRGSRARRFREIARASAPERASTTPISSERAMDRRATYGQVAREPQCAPPTAQTWSFHDERMRAKIATTQRRSRDRS
jgi:hypothetical protein